MPKPTEFHEAFARALAPVSPRVLTLDSTPSTNDDAKALARDGAPHGTVVVANEQTAGRGRAGRGWESGAGVSLIASWVVRPPMPPDRWPVLPLLVGVAVADAVRARTSVEATLKWPNDVLAGDRKLAGILVEAEPPAFAIAGVGLNVAQTRFEDPLQRIATSIAREGGIRLDRADLLAHVLRRFEDALREPAAALGRYEALSSTLGREVRVETTGGATVRGNARAIGSSGELILDVAGEEARIAAGDVVHLR